MMFPKLYSSLEEALYAMGGKECHVKKRMPVSGGDINEAYDLELSNGRRFFMKSNRADNADFFAAEAAGLAAIAQTGAIRTPVVLAMGQDGGRAFLLMDFIIPGPRHPHYWEIFGQQLAAMHDADTKSLTGSGRFGFMQDNYIGYSKQVNHPCETSWIDFYRERRLAPQFKMAERYFTPGDAAKINKLLDRLDKFLMEPEKPSLLHGDLWSGNFTTGKDGKAWLIDPAVYVGHAEADIAMTELFGGFSPSFYAAYREARPLQPGYEDRRDLYHLYHLLNHLNMFGGSYLYSVRRIVERYV